jgi:hypothetical protein
MSLVRPLRVAALLAAAWLLAGTANDAQALGPRRQYQVVHPTHYVFYAWDAHPRHMYTYSRPPERYRKNVDPFRSIRKPYRTWFR